MRARDLHHNDFTENQMKLFKLDNVPIVYDHTDHGGFPIGKVTRSWLDSEGWMRIAGEIDTRTISGRAAAAQVEHGPRKGLSLTHIYELDERIGGEPGWFESKEFKEVAILRPEDAEREGCVSLTGEHIEIEEEQERISGTDEATRRPPAETMDPKLAQAKLELELEQARSERDKLVENLETFTVGARAKEQEMEGLQARMKEREDKSTAMQTQLDGFFERDRVRLDAQRQEVLDLLPDVPEAAQALEGAMSLAVNPSGIEKMGALLTVVSNNMKLKTRDEQEDEVQEFKNKMRGAQSISALVKENNKRYRTPAGARPSSSPEVTASARDLAILDAINYDMGGN